VRTVAEGYRAAAVARATGDAQRFDLLVAQYKAAPDATRKRLWLETVQEVLGKNRVVVGGDGRQLIYVPMPAASASQTTAPPLLPEVLSPAVSATADGNDVRPGREPRSADREVER
jgi:membrane protease subunit HflK